MSAVTPGQALHDSLRDSAAAAFGRPVTDFGTWDQIPQWQRDRLEEAGKEIAMRIGAAGVPDSTPGAEDEAGQLREELARIRERLGNLAAGLELSAGTSHPSKKSEIEHGCARAVRAIAEG